MRPHGTCFVVKERPLSSIAPHVYAADHAAEPVVQRCKSYTLCVCHIICVYVPCVFAFVYASDQSAMCLRIICLRRVCVCVSRYIGREVRGRSVSVCVCWV